MRVVLVFGGRAFYNAPALNAALDLARQTWGDFAVLHGGARGADGLGGEWAKAHGLPVLVMPAPWQTHGNQAGPTRNQWMLEIGKPWAAIKFPGGSGTRGMDRRLVDAGVTVWRPLE